MVETYELKAGDKVIWRNLNGASQITILATKWDKLTGWVQIKFDVDGLPVTTSYHYDKKWEKVNG